MYRDRQGRNPQTFLGAQTKPWSAQFGKWLK